MRTIHERSRAERTIEDVVRIYPGGAPTMVLLDRLERMGMTELEALDILRELESAGRLATENGRWVVPEK